MLRNFEYHPSLEAIIEVLKQFKLELSRNVALLRFEVITPDSFMWRLLIGDGIYYLYAEDYVPGLKHVRSVFTQYLGNKNWELIPSRTTIQFASASPVQHALTYKEPGDSAEMMQYTVDSGHDFIFLARSNEDASNARFSQAAARGFAPE